jgi:hypothetical protein
MANSINREPDKVYKKNNKADLILFSPEPYIIIKINNRGNTLSKNTKNNNKSNTTNKAI